MGTTLSEELLKLKAGFAKSYQENRGNLDGFNAAWQEQEGDFLIMAQRLTDEANTTGDTEAQAAKTANLRRSSMTPKQKAAFIEEHGADAFKEIPYE